MRTCLSKPGAAVCSEISRDFRIFWPQPLFPKVGGPLFAGSTRGNPPIKKQGSFVCRSSDLIRILQRLAGTLHHQQIF
jgi:hypothetical protein